MNAIGYISTKPIWEMEFHETVIVPNAQMTLWTCPICGGKTSDEYISCDFCGENSIPKEIK